MQGKTLRMSMAIWQGLCARIFQRSSSAGRCLASTSEHFQSSSFMQASNPLAVPRLINPAGDAHTRLSEAPIWSQFIRLMAVPKRKVSPSRKGKRNGPKALKPVPAIAKCKVCGRIKVPHFYCCSGGASLPQQN